MNPDQRRQLSGHAFNFSSDLRALDLPREPAVNFSSIPSLPPVMGHRATRPPNPAYNGRRRSTMSSHPLALTSHPDDNPGPWTRRSASWSRAEDERLAQLVRMEEANSPKNTPTKMWSRVAAQLTGRTGKQCRERWLNQLKPGIRRGSWTDEEERILHEAHAQLGNKWVAIAHRLPGRTDNCVKNHWNSMLRKRQRREAAVRASYAAASRAVHNQMGEGISAGMAGLGDMNPELARRASAIAEDKKMVDSAAAYYNVMRSQNPAMFESMGRSLMELPGLTSPITPQRNAKLQIANLVVPARDASSFDRNESGRIGEKRLAPPLNYDSAPLSKRRSVLHPSAQMNVAADRHLPMNRALNPPGLNYYPDLGRSGQHAEGNQQLSALMPYVRHDEPVAVYPYNGQYTSMSPVSTPVGGGAPGYPTLDQRVWLPSAYGMAENKLPEPKLLAPAGADLTKSVVANMGVGDVKHTRSGSASGLHENMGAGCTGGGSGKGGSQTPGRPGKQLHFLSMVASSVPPSPLTPESRFSSTSLSGTSSPAPSGDRTRATSPEQNGLGTGCEETRGGAPALAPHMHVPNVHIGQGGGSRQDDENERIGIVPNAKVQKGDEKTVSECDDGQQQRHSN